jgi:hypothetical protein
MHFWPVICLFLLLTVPLRAANSRVVIVHEPGVVERFVADPAKAGWMVSAGMEALAGTNDARAAWGRFCSSSDIVGIKINTQGAPLHGTHRAVVDAIAAGLRAAGVPATNIWVFDRDLVKMRARGFAAATATQEVALTGPAAFDATVFYDNRLAGRLIWGDLLFGRPGEELSTRSHLPKLLTQRLSKLINVPALQDHEASGLAGCLYNLSLGLVDNTRRFEGGRSDAAIAEICALPAIRGKAVLHIVDGLVGGFAGGPSFKPQFGWQYNRLLFSTDPVALDTLCLEQIEQQRRAANVPAIAQRSHHVAFAARLGLGVNQRDKMDVVELAGSGDARKDDKK